MIVKYKYSKTDKLFLPPRPYKQLRMTCLSCTCSCDKDTSLKFIIECCCTKMKINKISFYVNKMRIGTVRLPLDKFVTLSETQCNSLTVTVPLCELLPYPVGSVVTAIFKVSKVCEHRRFEILPPELNHIINDYMAPRVTCHDSCSTASP